MGEPVRDSRPGLTQRRGDAKFRLPVCASSRLRVSARNSHARQVAQSNKFRQAKLSFISAMFRTINGERSKAAQERGQQATLFAGQFQSEGVPKIVQNGIECCCSAVVEESIALADSDQ